MAKSQQMTFGGYEYHVPNLELKPCHSSSLEQEQGQDFQVHLVGRLAMVA